MHKNNKKSDDVDIEFEEEIIQESTLEEKTKKLKQEIQTAKIEAKTNLDGWQRARADYINLKKTMEEEQGTLRRRTVEGILLELFPTLDNFDMAMKNKEVWEAVDQKWRTGIEYIYSQLQKTLTEYGAVEINDATIAFDPELHEPIEIVETEIEDEDNRIIEILQKGYKINDKVVRPAKVKIYKLT